MSRPLNRERCRTRTLVLHSAKKLFIENGYTTVYYKVIADKNYKDIEEQSITVKIEKTNIIIKADNLSIEQYTSLPNFTYQIDGLLKEDVIEVKPTLKVNIENSNTFGNFEIVISEVIFLLI